MTKFKLTTVSFSFRGRRLFGFFNLPLNEVGQPILPGDIQDSLLNMLGVQRGQTYSVGG